MCKADIRQKVVYLPHIACISRDSDYCITKYKPNLVIEQRSRAIPDIKMLVNKLLFGVFKRNFQYKSA